MYLCLFGYTLLLLVGSLIGYFKAGSVASLMTGLCSTILLTLFGALSWKGKRWAGKAVLGVVFVLDALFTWRFVQTWAVFPAGLFSGLSTILLIIIALRISK